MANFLLIHGAWHGGWCWEQVVPLLQAKGHEVLCPDLPEGNAAAADFVADLVRAAGEPVVLVGHSRGGAVISEAAERAPEGIRLLVYVAGFLLRDGQELFATAMAHPPKAALMRLSEDKRTTSVAAENAQMLLYADCPPGTAARAAPRLRREPASVFSTAVRVSAERFGRVPRAYIETLHDEAVPLVLQRQMVAALPCDPVISMATGHSPFYADPQGLAEILDGLAG